MSTQRGNSKRSRPQKHKNVNAFKNSMHDTTRKTQMLNTLDVYGVCLRCKEQIEWRIKYKKYKPLAAPKKCVRCEQKTVKRAYTSACQPCGAALGVCVKCLEKKELVEKSTLTQEEENKQKQELAAELSLLPERQRRALERNMREGKVGEPGEVGRIHTDEGQSSESESDDEDTVVDSAEEQRDEKTRQDEMGSKEVTAASEIEDKMRELSTANT